MSHLTAESIGSPYAIRRLVQTVYHGLMSLDIKPVSSARNALFRPMLIPESAARYRYLYSFLYRRAIEAGVWRLGRSFGRPDIRVDLLTMFVRPSVGVNMLAQLGKPDTSPLASIGTQHIAEPLKQDPALWCDLLEAVGRSGCDLGAVRGADAVKSALQMLPGSENTAQTHALLPRRPDGSSYYRVANAAVKLRVDWRQSQGRLDDAAIDCWGGAAIFRTAAS